MHPFVVLNIHLQLVGLHNDNSFSVCANPVLLYPQKGKKKLFLVMCLFIKLIMHYNVILSEHMFDQISSLVSGAAASL